MASYTQVSDQWRRDADEDPETAAFLNNATAPKPWKKVALAVTLLVLVRAFVQWQAKLSQCTLCTINMSNLLSGTGYIVHQTQSRIQKKHLLPPPFPFQFNLGILPMDILIQHFFSHITTRVNTPTQRW